jgi:S-adenosyl methyltransferase
MGDEGDRDGPRRARPGLVDATVPNTARAADYLDGGHGHFAADREAVRALTDAVPAAERIPAEARAFRRRVVRYLAAEAGLRQFLDIGTGLVPTGATHELAQAADPASRILYTESDPLMLARLQDGLASAPPGTARCVSGDIADVDAILADAKDALDLDQPTAVLLLSTLAHVPSLVGATRALGALMAAVPPGSYVAIYHLASDLDPALPAAVRGWNRTVRTPLTLRSRADVLAMVADLELVPPGVVPVTEWRPEPGAAPPPPVPVHSLVARKP